MLDVSCEPAGHDPFGAVAGGTLTIKAQMVEARCVYEVLGCMDDPRRAEYKVERQGRSETLDADYPLAEAGEHHVPSGQSVFCLRDGRTGPKAPLGNKALVLRRSRGGSSAFERIGIVDAASKQFDD